MGLLRGMKFVESVWNKDANSNQSDANTTNDEYAEYMSLNPVVGIDFGTSNSCVAVWHFQKSRTKVIRTKRYNGCCDAQIQ